MEREPEEAPYSQGAREDIPFMEQLRRYQTAGVEITLKDASLPLEDIAKICAVREKGAYMCDFVADDQNYIVRMNFDDIRAEEEETDDRSDKDERSDG